MTHVNRKLMPELRKTDFGRLSFFFLGDKKNKTLYMNFALRWKTRPWSSQQNHFNFPLQFSVVCSSRHAESISQQKNQSLNSILI